jgi:DNA-binding MarR family transcriptional regulator
MIDLTTQGRVDQIYDGLSVLFRASRRARQRWAEEHPGLPTGLVTLLTQIDRLEQSPESGTVTGCRLKDLAATAGLDASTVSREIAQLIARGLVERRSDPADGRAARLALTPAGRALLADVHIALVDRLAQAVRSWEPADVDAFAMALHRFADGLAAASARPGAPLLPSPAPSEPVPSMEVTR